MLPAMGQAPATPAAYCRKCDYALTGLPEKHRCPECGQEFDLSNPKTFRCRPRRRWWRIARWFVYPLVVATLVLGGGVGWCYREWKREQPVIAWAKGLQLSRVDTKPIGPALLQKWAGDWGYLLQRTDRLTVASDRPLTPGQVSLARLNHLTRLQLYSAGVGDEFMGDVGQLRELKGLGLWHTTVTDDGLARLSACRRLEVLDLHFNSRVGEKGLVILTNHPALISLDLSDTSADDRCLPVLKGLTRLRYLDLTRTKLTPAVVAELKEALPNCQIIGPDGNEIEP